MRKSRGLTLVEIIVAMAVLGIITVGFMPALMSNFTFLEKTKEITANSFLSQKSMEIAIEDMKKKIENDTGSMTFDNATYFDGVSVKYKAVTNTSNGVSYTTLVSQTRLPEEEKLNLTSVSTKFYKGTKKLYNVYPTSDSKVVSTVVNEVAENWMANIYEWYVSDYGYNIPAPQGNIIDNPTYNYLTEINEIDIGNKYPIFPDDYSLISSSTSDTLLDMTPYAGRHLILKVTPASKTGKLGNEKWSNPLLVSGLTETDNLAFHLDASYIDPTKNTGTDRMVSLSGSNIRVERWYDLSAEPPGINDYYPSEIGLSSGTLPLLYENPIDASFVSRYVSFTSAGTVALNGQGTSNRTISVYAVVRGEVGTRILRNGTNRDLLIPDVSTGSVEIIGNSGGTTENWKIVKLSLPAVSSTAYNNFTIGGSNIDIAELIVYRGAHDASKVLEYLDKKYKPSEQEYVIDRLYDMLVEVDAGDIYLPPIAVLGKMIYGGNRYVLVTWSNGGAQVNTANTTSAVIDRTVTGSSIVSITNPTVKNMTLTVKVYPRVSAVTVTPTTHTMNIGETQQLTATVAPSIARNKALTWSSSNPAVATVNSVGLVSAFTPGTTVITATSVDGGKIANSTITVNSNSMFPQGLVLHLDASKTESIERSSSGVTRWKDVSSNDNHFDSVGSNNNRHRPSLTLSGINNLPSLTFDEQYTTTGPFWNPSYTYYYDYLVNANIQPSLLSDLNNDDGGSVDLYADNDAFSVFIVGKSDTTNNTRTLNQAFLGKGTTTTVSFAMGTTNNGARILSALRGNSSNVTITGNSTNVISGIWTGTNPYRYRVNGGSSNTLNSGVSGAANNPIVIGDIQSSTSYTYPLIGNIGEILVFNRALTDAERDFVEGYLRSKWIITPIRAWDFSTSTDGVSVQNDLRTITHDTTNGTVSMGVFESGGSAGIDPILMLSNSLSFPASSASKIVVRMKNETTSNMAQLYYRTSNGSWHDDRHIDFTIVPKQTGIPADFYEYTIDMTSAPGWNGTIYGLRLDPATEPMVLQSTNNYGTITIDYVRITN